MNKPTTSHNNAIYIGIDFHKRYSVFCAIDSADRVLERGRIDHATPELFVALVKCHPGCRVTFETTLNWAWLYEVLEPQMPPEDIILADAFKTRIIAESQVKNDKVDAHILARLLRAGMICEVHIPSKAARQRKEVLRQRSFFVRQRTRVRNRIHRLLGAQHKLRHPDSPGNPMSPTSTKSAGFENSTAGSEAAPIAVETRSEFRYRFKAAAPQKMARQRR